MSLQDVATYLKSLKEDDLRAIIFYYFNTRISNSKTELHHGSGEHGLDILSYIDHDLDPLNQGEVLYIQVKCGDINCTEWVDKISGQLYSALRTHKSPQNIDENLPKRLILMTNGNISPEAKDAITEWNNYEHIPVLWFDLLSLSNFFITNNVQRKDLETWLPLT